MWDDVEPVEAILGRSSTIVDLLDRVLDKGLVINADIIISVAGIPLIGVNLRAALAGMETMMQYGMMKDWDERTRAFRREDGDGLGGAPPSLPPLPGDLAAGKTGGLGGAPPSLPPLPGNRGRKCP